MLFTRADKDSVTVTIDRATYDNDMKKLQDKDTYKTLIKKPCKKD